MMKRVISFLLALVMLIGMIPMMALEAEAATTLSYAPYAKVEYEYSANVEVGTIRYISQNSNANGSNYFYTDYWPASSFGYYSSPTTECGTACISMALSYVGVDRTPKKLLEDTKDGQTHKMWGTQGSATSKSISKSQAAVSSAMNDYINGNGKYSPLCLYLKPFNANTEMHWVLLVGKIKENEYLALNPWHNTGITPTFTIKINETTATYNGITNPIDSINQWYNANATICDHKKYYKGTGICSNCNYVFPWESTFDPGDAGVYKFTKSFTPRWDKPYDDATPTDFCTAVGSEVEVLGSYTNAYENTWYKCVADDGKIYYAYGEYLECLRPLELKATVSNFSPAAGSVLPAQAYPVEGMITSNVPLKAVEGYLDGTYYATWSASNKTTTSVNIRNTDLNYKLDFGSLSEGVHTITFRAKDFVNSGSVKFFSSTFTISSSGGGGTTSYTVKFAANGGSCAVASCAVKAGSAIGELPECELANMQFVGWFTEPYGGTEVTADTVPTSDMELFAHYVNWGVATKLEFDPNGGTLPGPVYTVQTDGVNRGRPADSLVVFNKSGTQPDTNSYGYEIAVNSLGKIVGIRDYGDGTQLTVPNGGFILSGHLGGDTSGAAFVKKIIEMDEAYVSLDYETGIVKIFDSYAGYLNETKTGQEWFTYGVLPVPTREGYVFEGWNTGYGDNVNYFSSFAGIYLSARWCEEDSLCPVATMEYDGHYYELYDYNVSWTKAKALCEALGGHLLVINNANEQAKIVSLITQGTRGLYRIGATDAATEGTWKWVNGDSFTYNNWDPQTPEPNDGTNGNYSSIVAIENSLNKQVGEWIDEADTAYGNFYDLSNAGFICEYDHEPSCEHSWNAATCTVAKTCKICGVTEGSALGHSFGSWIVVTKPSVFADGLEKRTCVRCGQEETRVLAKLDNPFTDVPVDSFYYEPVLWAVENDVTTGTSATTFSPNDSCTRAQVVTFLHRAAGCPEPTMSFNPFTDVTSGSFYYKPVLWAVQMGITNGTSTNTFGSLENCNRAQVVTFLWRAMGSPKPTSTSNPFVDVPETAFYYKAVLWAVENGITNGVDATHFGPTNPCNRAQVVTFLYRTMA